MILFCAGSTFCPYERDYIKASDSLNNFCAAILFNSKIEDDTPTLSLYRIHFFQKTRLDRSLKYYANRSLIQGGQFDYSQIREFRALFVDYI